MPYQKVRGGYTTKRGGFLRDPAQYEALRRKGMSKEQAARIVNKSVKGFFKEHKREEETAAGAVVGGGAGQGVYQGAGYGTKHFVDSRTRAGHARVTREQVKLQDKMLRANKRKFGMHNPNGSPLRNNAGYHRSYPKELPYGKVIRTLGWTHEGKAGMATGAAATVVGAAAAGAAVHHHVKKFLGTPKTPAQIKRRKREAAALGTTTALIGLGTLAARGGEGVLRQVPKFKASPVARNIAGHLHSSQQTALVVNAGIGGVGGLNYAAVNRAEGRQKQKVAKGERYIPTPEQVAAAKARREAQAAAKNDKQFVRVKGKPIPFKSHFERGPVRNAAISAGLAGGTMLLIHAHNKHTQPVAKFDKHQGANAALGAVAGGAVADTALTVGGQAGKAVLKERRARRGISPHEEEVWAQHKAKFGLKRERVPGDESIPQSQKVKIFSKYPKELPDWRLQRALAFKNRPAFTAAAIGTGAATGALIAGRRKKVAKSAAGEAARAAKLAARAARPKLSQEEIDALRARKAERIASGEAQAPPPPKPKQDPNAQVGRAKSSFLGRGQIRDLAVGIPIAAGGLGYAHHSGHVKKSDDTKRSALAGTAGAVGGAAALDAADTITGATLKRAAARARAKAGDNPEHRATLKEHQVKFGFTDERGRGRNPLPSDPHKLKHDYYRNYPKDLPGGKLQRLNALRDRKTGLVLATGAALGAGYGLARAHKAAKKGPLVKSDEFAPFGVVHKGWAGNAMKAVSDAASKTGEKAGKFGTSFNAGFSRKVGRTATANTVPMKNAFRAGHLTRRFGVPTAVVAGSYGVGAELGRRSVNKAYKYDPEAERHRRTGFYTGAAAVGSGVMAGGAAHQGTKAVRAGLLARKEFKTTHTMGSQTKTGLRDIKFTNAKVGVLASQSARKGGRALMLAGGAGALAGGYRHIRRQTNPPSRPTGTYHGYY